MVFVPDDAGQTESSKLTYLHLYCSSLGAAFTPGTIWTSA
jgi:hypothetical protein